MEGFEEGAATQSNVVTGARITQRSTKPTQSFGGDEGTAAETRVPKKPSKLPSLTMHSHVKEAVGYLRELIQ